MQYGYTGKILFVDLTSGEIKEETPSDQIYREYIGGTGLGARILYEKIKPGADPLGPDNVLGFVTGPLTGTSTPGSGRYTVVTKSPLTGAWADANSGGYWGPELKYTGYDAIFLSGISEKPVVLSIINGKAKLKDASHVWGKNTRDTEIMIKKDLGEEDARIACIGPSGENLSLLSGIVNENGRIAARSGVGAVMGSKRLKAVAVRGTGDVTVARPEELEAVKKAFFKTFKENPFNEALGAFGTGVGTSMLVSIGDSSVKNWSEAGTDAMPTCEKLDSGHMDPYKIKRYGCHSCTLRCGALIKVDAGSYATDGEIHRPEYETLAAFGGNCFNDDIEVVIKANEICNLYGIDTIGVGNAIAFAMECWDKGLITEKDTGGLDLAWGNGESIVALTEQIAKREGFGASLADGSKAAAEKIGKGSEEYAMAIRGQGLPYHDPRISPVQGPVYYADANPGRHMDSCGSTTLEKGGAIGADPILSGPQLEMYADYDSKGTLMSIGVPFLQFFSSAGMCSLFLLGNTVPVVEYIAAVTGWDMDAAEAIKAGKRIATLRQAFNVREGLKPTDFKLPKRFLQPLNVGPAAGQLVDFDAVKAGYFASMGWDLKSGRPYLLTLKELGLESLVRL